MVVLNYLQKHNQGVLVLWPPIESLAITGVRMDQLCSAIVLAVTVLKTLRLWPRFSWYDYWSDRESY
jgi:hypothetical protein